MAIYKHKVNNKLKGAYGMIDLDKKVITINKKMHQRKDHPSGTKTNKDGKANLLDTLVHEGMHAKHPQMTEKMVRKMTTKALDKMHPKQKAKLYGKYR